MFVDVRRAWRSCQAVAQPIDEPARSPDAMWNMSARSAAFVAGRTQTLMAKALLGRSTTRVCPTGASARPLPACCRKCYERTNHTLAGSRALASGLAVRVANMVVDMCTRFRHVNVQGVVSQIHSGDHGVVAGCVFAKDLLEAF